MSVLNRDRRRTRFGLWACIGLVGASIDIAITTALLGSVHYLLANAAGFSVAVCLNWAGNFALTYRRPAGSPLRQWAQYVGLHSLTFSGRAVVIAGLVEVAGVPVIPATAAGIATAVLINFAGTESIFGRAEDLSTALSETLNQAAHLVWGSRVRAVLIRSGLYAPVYRAYRWGLGVAHRAPERTVTVGDASANLLTETATETVSVMHTLRAEEAVLERWVKDIQPEDRVLDVGSNVGVFATLAGDIAKEVVAVEPHETTARRCERNLTRNTVYGRVHRVALGEGRDTVGLATRHDKPGTQRGSVTDGGSISQLAGDDLEIDPTVIKVDVEGSEAAVLSGLSQTLATVRVIYVEGHSGAAADRLTDKLEGHGFAVERLTDGAEVHLRGVRA